MAGDPALFWRDLLFRFLAEMRGELAEGGAGVADPVAVLVRLYRAEMAAAWGALAQDLEARGFVYETKRLDAAGLEVHVKRCSLAETLAGFGLADMTEPRTHLARRRAVRLQDWVAAGGFRPR